MSLRFRPGLAALLSTVVGGAAMADTVVINPTKDNTVLSNSANSNGAGEGVFAGKTGGQGGSRRLRALLAFDVAGHVPAGATITSATLTLTLDRSASGDQTHTLHKLLSDWGEGTSNRWGGQGAPATKGDATWTWAFFPTDAWQTPGGYFDETSSASAEVGLESGPIIWGPTTRMTADVQGWLDDPTTSFGWIMKGNEIQGATAKKFASKDHANESIHPVLFIEFERPSCPGDLDGSGDVGFQDLLAVLAAWGVCGGCPEDLDGSGAVDFGDVLLILGNWGPCA